MKFILAIHELTWFLIYLNKKIATLDADHARYWTNTGVFFLHCPNIRTFLTPWCHTTLVWTRSHQISKNHTGIYFERFPSKPDVRVMDEMKVRKELWTSKPMKSLVSLLTCATLFKYSIHWRIWKQWLCGDAKNHHPDLGHSSHFVVFLACGFEVATCTSTQNKQTNKSRLKHSTPAYQKKAKIKSFLLLKTNLATLPLMMSSLMRRWSERCFSFDRKRNGHDVYLLVPRLDGLLIWLFSLFF